MGDAYRRAPRRGGAEYDRDERYDYHHGRTERYAPFYRDGHHSQQYYSSYPPSPPRDRGRDYGRSDAGFTFRGAAERDRYEPRRPEETFSFRAINHPAPSFRSRSPIPRERSPRPQKRRPQPSGQFRNHHEMNGLRGDRRQGGRGRGRFNAAHNRDILRHTQRGNTPERLAGMNTAGQPRFRIANGADDNVIDLARDTGSDLAGDSDDAPRKRVKVEPSRAAVEPPQAAVAPPKWSNPDPYTSLPPPSTFGGPQVDVVQLIRKAKLNADPSSQQDSANAVRNNADFVGFNEASEEGEASDDSVVSVSPRRPRSPEFRPISLAKAKQKLNSLSKPPAPTKRPRPGFTLDDDEESVGYPPPPRPPPPGLGKKRKLAEQSRDFGSILPEWDARGSNPTPWFVADNSSNAKPAFQKLNDEILAFFDFVRPYDHENEVRTVLVQLVERAVKNSNIPLAKGVRVDVFGSFASGLYLPTGDMDLVAISDLWLCDGEKAFCQSTSNMRRLAQNLEMAGVAAPGTVTWISKAKVPLIKFTDRLTGVKVDISFENPTGLTAISTVKRWKEEHPAMPMLVLMIKQFLAMRGLNEVFTGGLGGFSIICLVVSMFQLSPKVKLISPGSADYYARLLLEFFDLYGNRFDVVKDGISMNPPRYFDKFRDPAPTQNNNRLTIIDPNNHRNDISGGTSKIRDVFEVFRKALLSLEGRVAKIDVSNGTDNGSILGCIFGGNYDVFARQREKMTMLRSELEDTAPSASPSPPPSRPAPKRKADDLAGSDLTARRQKTLREIKEHQRNKQRFQYRQKNTPRPNDNNAA